MGNAPKFNQAITPSIDDIKLMLGKHPIFGAEEQSPQQQTPDGKPEGQEQQINPLEKTVQELQATIEANAAELKKYKDAEEAAQRKNNTDVENFRKDLEAATNNYANEKNRADSVTARLENEILINKILENGTFKKEAIKFVVQELDRDKVKVNLETREVTNLENSLKKIAENFSMFVADGSGGNNGNSGNNGNNGNNGINGANQNGNPWTRAGSPPAPPSTQDQEAAQRNSMMSRYSALRSGR